MKVNGRLAQSLHQAVLTNLGKQAQPEQVRRPWDAEIKLGAKAPEPLLPETSILNLFKHEEMAGRLLILGDPPGAGKTTTLLHLAQALVHQAEADSSYSIPVLLNLSSWKDPKLAMQDWVLEELKSKYGVGKATLFFHPDG
jgi:predicted NACHT family NTPase